MKSRLIKSTVRFRVGELYLFHASDPRCPADGSLYGMFGKRVNDRICLESGSLGDLELFARWFALPSRYRYVRLATRAELRDYMYALAAFECGGSCR